MARRRTNLIGQQFGKLTVVADLGIEGKRHLWGCVCNCGNKEQVVVTQDHLLRGLTKSCGCIHDSVGKKNLRLIDGTSVTKLEKRRGRVCASNTSGYTGVYMQNSHGRKTGRWAAQIGFKGEEYYLGSFDKIEDAAEARKKAEENMYGNFLKWYYDEYLPEQEKNKAGNAGETATGNLRHC